MEAVAYDIASAEKRLEFKAANVQPILQVSTKKFPNAFGQCAIAANRRFLALNSKNPGFIKVFQRITARHLDLGELITGEVVDLHFMADVDKFVVTSNAKEVVIVTMTENGDQSLSASEVKTTLSAVAEKVTTYTNADGEKAIVALTTDGTLFDISFTGAQPKQIAAVSNIKNSAESLFLGAALGSNTIAVPGADGSVQVLDAGNNFSSLLAKNWFPHGGEAVNDVIVLDASTEEAGTLRIVTAAENSSELRFWVLKNNSATLSQTLTLTNTVAAKKTDTAEEGEAEEKKEEAAAAPTENHRKLIVDPNFAYIGVLSSTDSSAVMLELDTANFGVRRVTEWASNSPFACGTLLIRKHAAGSKLSQDLTLMGRTNERVAILTFDAARLEGAPNLGESAEKKNGAKKGKGADANILKWFGSGKDTNGAAEAKNPDVAVSSSNNKSGNKTAVEAAEAKNTAAMQQELARVTESVRVLLGAIKDGVEGLQPIASENLTMLQAQGFGDLADALGRAKALELNLPTSTGGRAPIRDDKIRRLYQSIADNALAQMNNVATVSFERTLKKNADRVGPKLSSGSVSAKDIPVPKLGGTESMKSFATRMDKAHSLQNEGMRREMDKVKIQCDELVASVKKRSLAATTVTKLHLRSVQEELNGLKSEVTALASAQPRAAGTVVAGKAGPTNVLEKCRALALSGNWEQAFAQLLEAANLALLVQFLELDEVVNNRAAITSTGCLSFPVILALCQQLTHNINAQAGTVPLRVGWLHDILLGWDEEFGALKRGESADADLFSRCGGDFESMSSIVASISRGDVDAATRRQLSFVKKMLSSLS